MPAQWLSHSSEVSGRVGAVLTRLFNVMAQPAHARRLRRFLLMLFAFWAVLALARLLWALVPVAAPAPMAPDNVVNAVSTSPARVGADPVDVKQMVGWHLFGQAGAPAAAPVRPEITEQANARDGIENGARETRLQLKLRGIVASTQDGLGYAIIENKSRQAVYAVGDKLPVPGQVVLAKVMPQQVVLDNGGTYELLVLFDDSSLGAASTAASAPTSEPPDTRQQIDKRNDPDATSLALSYRRRLYENPQSLAEVVNVSAVRANGNLRGYRVQPGRDKEQFERLGFQPGDLVTAVNGISLDNPTNTMVLYNAMRTAGEAVFDLERGGQQLSLSVNLDSGATQ